MQAPLSLRHPRIDMEIARELSLATADLLRLLRIVER